MTEPHRPPPDDELVSAYLDGEATPDEVARVEAEPALRARVDELRALSSQVRAVPSPPAPAREAHLARAVDELAAAGAPGATVSEASPVAPVADLEQARARRRRSLLLGAAAAVAAVVLAAGILPSLLDDGEDASQTASTETEIDGDAGADLAPDELDADAAAPPAGPESAEAAPPADASTPSTAAEGGSLDAAPPDLGSFATYAELEAALARSLEGRAAGARGVDAFAPAGTCEVAVVATDAELRSLVTAARATLAGRPVEVLLFATDPASSANGPMRLYVVDPGTCAPIVDGVRTITP